MIPKEKAESFLFAVGEGVDAETAARGAGLATDTVFSALERGMLEEEHRNSGGRPRKKEEDHFLLWQEYNKNSARAIGRSLSLIRQHAAEDWKAARFMVEYLNAKQARFSGVTGSEDGVYYMGRESDDE